MTGVSQIQTIQPCLRSVVSWNLMKIENDTGDKGPNTH